MSALNDRHLLIMGYGFSGQAIAARAHGAFTSISGSTRSEEKADTIRDESVCPALFDGNGANPELVEQLLQATHLLISIAPNDTGDPVLNALGDVLRASDTLQWIGYLSTVGVYGDHGGAWVDEDSALNPVSKRSLQRVEAESAWLAFAASKQVPLSIFRLSGIYGPGRNAFVNMEKGTARRLVKPGQVFNRIHCEDIGEAVFKAMENNIAGIFNITDDEPAPPQEVVTLAHELAGREPPPEIDFESANLTPMARSFYGENKRVSNARSKVVLSMSYRWPNYRESLKRMWSEGSWRGE